MPAYKRLSWRELAAGDRVYDTFHGDTVVLFVVPTNVSTRKKAGIPAWYATTGRWRLVPRTGVVKVVPGACDA